MERSSSAVLEEVFSTSTRPLVKGTKLKDTPKHENFGLKHVAFFPSSAWRYPNKSNRRMTVDAVLCAELPGVTVGKSSK